MPGKKSNKAKAKPTELRGVIDQIDGDIVVVVFDDEQRLDWPRRFVPEAARSGDAVIVRVIAADADHWSGEGNAEGQIIFGKQSLRWPGEIIGEAMALSIEIDAADTAARKERVQGLLDDIFKQQ